MKKYLSEIFGLNAKIENWNGKSKLPAISFCEITEKIRFSKERKPRTLCNCVKLHSEYIVNVRE